MNTANAPLVRVFSEREDEEKPKLVIRVKLTQVAEDCANGDSPRSVFTLALVDTGATPASARNF